MKYILISKESNYRAIGSSQRDLESNAILDADCYDYDVYLVTTGKTYVRQPKLAAQVGTKSYIDYTWADDFIEDMLR